MNTSRELAHVIRNGYVDLIHHGSVAVANAKGEIIYSVGDPDRPAFLRSSAKPLQIIAAAESGALEKYQISKKELAIMCASHAGQEIHMETVRGILAKIGLSEEALRCSESNAIKDNCSGKHSGMLMLCQFHNFPVEDYIEQDHPAQVMIRKTIGEMCELAEVEYGIDGCGAPAPYIPVSKAAVGFARLTTPSGLSRKRREAAKKIAAAMQTHPEMTNEIRNAKTWPKQIVAKSGALGMYCGGILGKDRGVAVKVDDGNASACALVFTEAIRRLELADNDELDAYQQLRPTEIKNRRGEVVGGMKAVF